MGTMTGTHVVGESSELEKWRPQGVGLEEEDWKEAQGGRAGEEDEEEGRADELEPEVFFCHIHEFLVLSLVYVLCSGPSISEPCHNS